MKTYIKQLIDSKGNNLIPVSSTSSCYNSNGQTADELLAGLRNDLDSNVSELSNSLTELEENITTQISADIEDLKNRSVKLAESVTWAQLQDLKNSKKLNPGQKYIVTDFKTTSSAQGTTTTGEGMKLILTATDKNSLDNNGLGIISSNGGGTSQDISSGTVTVKKLLMGDDQDEDNPGEWMIDQGTAVYLFHDMYEFDGSTYYRWMKYEPDGENYDYDDFYYPIQLQGNSRPVYILTSTDEWDFSNNQHYEPDFCITFDDETGGTDDYEIDKEIMGVEEVTVPLMLFVDKFDGEEDYPNLFDTGYFYTYVDSIDLGGTTYYRWAYFQGGDYSPVLEDNGNYLLTDTLNLTFDDVVYYLPYGYLTIDNEEAESDGYHEVEVRIIDTNYKSALSSSSGPGELVEVKYCLDNDISKFSWAVEDTTVETLEIYTDNELWFTNSRTEEIDSTTYYIWENNNFVDEDNDNSPCYLLSTTLELENGDSLDKINADLDPETISYDYSEITNTRTGTKTISTATGVIYWMKDKNNNEAPYDFKNILFSDRYTFDLYDSVNDEHLDYSLTSNCYCNKIEPYYNSGVLTLNNITFRNTDAENDLCKANYIEPDTHDVYYGPGTSNMDTRLILGEY